MWDGQLLWDNWGSHSSNEYPTDSEETKQISWEKLLHQSTQEGELWVSKLHYPLICKCLWFCVRCIDLSLFSNSYPDITLSKMVSYSSDPYDRAKEMLKVFLALPKLDFFLSGSQVLVLIKIRSSAECLTV